MLQLIPPEAIEGMGRGFTYGAVKYDEDAGSINYLNGHKYTDLIGGAMRHLNKFALGEDFDQNSGLHHIESLMCQAAMLYAQVKRGIGTDDRLKCPEFKKD